MISGIVRTGPGATAFPIAEGAEYLFPGGNTGHTSPSSVYQESLRCLDCTSPLHGVLVNVKYRGSFKCVFNSSFLGLDIS